MKKRWFLLQTFVIFIIVWSIFGILYPCGDPFMMDSSCSGYPLVYLEGGYFGSNLHFFNLVVDMGIYLIIALVISILIYYLNKKMMDKKHWFLSQTLIIFLVMLVISGIDLYFTINRWEVQIIKLQGYLAGVPMTYLVGDPRGVRHWDFWYLFIDIVIYAGLALALSKIFYKVNQKMFDQKKSA